MAPHVPHAELLLAAKAEGLLRVGKLGRAREFAGQPVHQDEGEEDAARAKRAPWRLWVQAQCSWQEGDAGGELKQQLTALAAALQAKEAAAPAALGAAQQGGAAGAAGAAAAGAPAAAPSAFFPSGAAAPAAHPEEVRRQEELAVLVGLPSSADVQALVAGLAAADALRLAGNAAVKANKAAEAVKKYTEALAGELLPPFFLRGLHSWGGARSPPAACKPCCYSLLAAPPARPPHPCLLFQFPAASASLSPAIAAVLLSNRAAAHQHLQQRAQVRWGPMVVRGCVSAAAFHPLRLPRAHSGDPLGPA